jgi:hypothetical protein
MLGLLQPYTCGCCSADTFAACQISKHKSAKNVFYLASFTFLRLENVNVQDSVRATGRFIHVLTCYLSVGQAGIHQIQSLVQILNRNLNQVINEDFAVILPDNHILAAFRI